MLSGLGAKENWVVSVSSTLRKTLLEIAVGVSIEVVCLLEHVCNKES